MAEWNNLFDARLPLSPPVSDEQLAKVSSHRGVVLLVGQGDVPIVMVTAANMRSRVKTRLASPHEDQSRKTKTPDLRQITQAVLYKRCESFFETELRFMEIAEQLWPDRYAKMLTWKPPWFVHIDLADPYPHFSKTRRFFRSRAGASGGQAFGPFLTGSDADKFIGALQDAFRLCRSIKCLRNAPHGPRCAYAEMNLCASPADGTISMDEYREKFLAEACRFAGGQREFLRQNIRAEMARAAKDLKFEQAGACKARLERLAFFEGEKFRHVRQAGEFRKILIHRGAGVHELRAFLACGGAVVYAGPMYYPLRAGQIEDLLKSMAELASRLEPCDQAAGLRLGLVVRTLFASKQRRSLAVNWHEGLTAEELAAAIENCRDDLGVKPKPDRAGRKNESKKF